MTAPHAGRAASFLIPQVITATRLIVSAVALIAAIEGDFGLAVRLIVIGLVIDSFDGPIAKRLNATSEFGSLFDYYSDYLGNVVAPAVLVFLILEPHAGVGAIVFASAPLLTGAIRYARNAVMMKSKPFDQAGYPGLGTVFFALFMAEIILLDAKSVLGESGRGLLVATATPIFSLMMVAGWRYPKMTKFPMLNVAACGVVILQLFVFTQILGSVVLLAIVSYALLSPVVLQPRN